MIKFWEPTSKVKVENQRMILQCFKFTSVNEETSYLWLKYYFVPHESSIIIFHHFLLKCAWDYSQLFTCNIHNNVLADTARHQYYLTQLQLLNIKCKVSLETGLILESTIIFSSIILDQNSPHYIKVHFCFFYCLTVLRSQNKLNKFPEYISTKLWVLLGITSTNEMAMWNISCWE